MTGGTVPKLLHQLLEDAFGLNLAERLCPTMHQKLCSSAQLLSFSDMMLKFGYICTGLQWSDILFTLLVLSVCLHVTETCSGNSMVQEVYLHTHSPMKVWCVYSCPDSCSHWHGHTPDDIHSGTEYLRLESLGLTDSSLNTSLLYEQLPHLWGLGIDHSIITLIPDVTLWSATLVILSLTNTNIHQLDLDTFSPMQALYYVNLDHNLITSQQIIPPSDGNPVLKIMSLAHNNMNVLNFQQFESVGYHTLVLDHNPISSSVPPSGSMEVDYLWIMGNHLSDMAFGDVSFHQFSASFLNPSFTVMDLEQLHQETYSVNIHDSRQLHTLSPVTSSRLMTTDQIYVEGHFTGCLHLQYFADHIFSDLTVLKFPGSKLTGFCTENVALYYTTRVEVLSLPGNLLTNLDLSYITSVTYSLTILELSDNHITTVRAPASDTWLQNLHTLDLRNNPLTVLGEYCHYYFNTFTAGFVLKVSNTLLECNQCNMWLKTCEYHINLTDSGTCAGPRELRTKRITELNEADMSRYECNSDGTTVTEASSHHYLYIKSPTSLNNVGHNVLMSESWQQSSIACARYVTDIGMPSFTYHRNNYSCHVYEVGGEMTLIS